MARRISLSRAARLVGVKRGVLQQQIRAGELKTFEGEIVLPDLLQAYPNAQIEDSSMLERVEQIIEQATFINADIAAHKPDNQALAARIMALGKELSRQRRLVGRYRDFVHELREQASLLDEEPDSRSRLRDWIEQTAAMVENDDDTIDQPFVNETFLRVMTAQATVLPSGHEFFVEGAESILEAGLRGGLALGYGCSNGNCGLCKMRVVSGEIRKADEAQGTSDIPTQNIALRIKRIEKANPQILIVSARTPRTSRLRFLAGQRATLAIDQVGSGHYPIASCPCDDMNLQFHLALDPADPLASYLAETAAVNDSVTLQGPVGSFVLNENSPHALVFIAEGIGFASIKGLIEHAMALDAAEHIYLFWIAADGDPPYLHNLCRAWNDALDNFDYVPLSASEGERINDHIEAQLGATNPAAFDYYLCAGDRLRDRIEEFVAGQAIPKHQLLCEAV
jgi:CDP-4-dehydro-6-deoxyglucose reductase